MLNKIIYIASVFAVLSLGACPLDNPYQYYGEECQGDEDCPAEGLECDTIHNVCVGKKCVSDADCLNGYSCEPASLRCVLNGLRDDAGAASDAQHVTDAGEDDLSMNFDGNVFPDVDMLPDVSPGDAGTTNDANPDFDAADFDGFTPSDAGNTDTSPADVNIPDSANLDAGSTPDGTSCSLPCPATEICKLTPTGTEICVIDPCNADNECPSPFRCIAQHCEIAQAYDLCSINDEGASNCDGNLQCFLFSPKSRLGLCLEPCDGPNACNDTQRCLPIGLQGNVSKNGQGSCVEKCGSNADADQAFIQDHDNPYFPLQCTVNNANLGLTGSILPLPPEIELPTCTNTSGCNGGPFACVRKSAAHDTGQCMLLAEALVQQTEGQLIYSDNLCPADTHPIYSTTLDLVGCAGRCTDDNDCNLMLPEGFTASCILPFSGAGYCVANQKTEGDCFPSDAHHLYIDDSLTICNYTEFSTNQDSDQDGFTNSSDRCPNEFGPVNGCNVRGSCRSNLDCFNDDVCISGKCQKRTDLSCVNSPDPCPIDSQGFSAASYCTNASGLVCIPNEYLRNGSEYIGCLVDEDCAATGEKCIGNMCFAEPTEPNTCYADEILYYGTCLLPPNMPTNFPCLSASDCPDTMFCEGDHCQLDPNFAVAYNACSSDDACSLGTCQNGVCEGDGSVSCTLDADCQIRTCVAGRCTGQVESTTGPCPDGTGLANFEDTAGALLSSCVSCYDITQNPVSLNLPCNASGSDQCPCNLECAPDADGDGQCVSGFGFFSMGDPQPGNGDYCEGDGMWFNDQCWHNRYIPCSSGADCQYFGDICYKSYQAPSTFGFCGPKTWSGEIADPDVCDTLPEAAICSVAGTKTQGICIKVEGSSKHCLPIALIPAEVAVIDASATIEHFQSAGPGQVWGGSRQAHALQPGYCGSGSIYDYAMDDLCFSDPQADPQLNEGAYMPCTAGDIPGTTIALATQDTYFCRPTYDAPSPYCGFDRGGPNLKIRAGGWHDEDNCRPDQACQLGYCVNINDCPTDAQSNPRFIKNAISCRLVPNFAISQCDEGSIFCDYFGDGSKPESGVCVQNGNSATCYPRVGCNLTEADEICLADAPIPRNVLLDSELRCDPWAEHHDCPVYPANHEASRNGSCLHLGDSGVCAVGTQCLSYLDCSPGENCLQGRCTWNWYHDNSGGTLATGTSCESVSGDDSSWSWVTDSQYSEGCYPEQDPRCVGRVAGEPCATTGEFYGGICDALGRCLY